MPTSTGCAPRCGSTAWDRCSTSSRITSACSAPTTPGGRTCCRTAMQRCTRASSTSIGNACATSCTASCWCPCSASPTAWCSSAASSCWLSTPNKARSASATEVIAFRSIRRPIRASSRPLRSACDRAWPKRKRHWPTRSTASPWPLEYCRRLPRRLRRASRSGSAACRCTRSVSPAFVPVRPKSYVASKSRCSSSTVARASRRASIRWTSSSRRRSFAWRRGGWRPTTSTIAASSTSTSWQRCAWKSRRSSRPPIACSSSLWRAAR